MSQLPLSVREFLRKKLSSPQYAGHAAPQSRRDLLKLGAISFGAAASAPWWSWASSGTVAVPTVPFLTFDLAGGAGLPANFLVGMRGGPLDLCGSLGQTGYRAHGWNPRESDALDDSFGLPMSKKHSRILSALKAELSPEMYHSDGRSKAQMASILHFALDDQPTNLLSAVPLVASAGLKGDRIRAGLGLRNSLTGGYSRGPSESARTKPRVIARVSDLTRLMSLSPTFDGLTSQRRRDAMAFWADGLRSEARRRGVLDEALEDALKQVPALGQELPECDPRQDPVTARIYNLNAQSSQEALIEAGVVQATLKRWTGPGVITIGECDYHTAPTNTWDRKDEQIGRSIGRALRAAHEFQTPLFFQIITDGGVYARESENFDRMWQGDNPQHSMTVMGYYHPDRTIEPRRLQIGAYTEAGLVDQTTIVGASPQVAALVTFANYLSVNNQLQTFDARSGRRFSNIGGDECIAFG